MSTKPHKGTLKNAVIMPVYTGGHYVIGAIYGHPAFNDGDGIHTSMLVDISDDGTEIETKNSRYTVEWAEGANPKQAEIVAEINADEQVEDAPITPGIPLEVVDGEVMATLPKVYYARILEDECGAEPGTVVRVDEYCRDGSISYTDEKFCVPGVVSSPGYFEFVGEVPPQSQPDPQLLMNIAEQFVSLFDNEELRHADIEYFADAFKDALRG